MAKTHFVQGIECYNTVAMELDHLDELTLSMRKGVRRALLAHPFHEDPFDEEARQEWLGRYYRPRSGENKTIHWAAADMALRMELYHLPDR